jgi:hypothetical protein
MTTRVMGSSTNVIWANFVTNGVQKFRDNGNK